MSVRRAFLAGALAIAALVPTGALGQEGAEVAVDVLAHAVARGSILSASDFERKPLAPVVARSALRMQDVAGMEAKRNLVAGTFMRIGDVTPAALVRRGEAVTLVVQTGAITISAPGRALGDGAQGAAVRVVNLATNRTLDGRVEGVARVTVAIP